MEPSEQQDERVRGGPLIGMRLWLTRSPWRLGAAWAAVAGALASGGLTWQGPDWVRLFLLVFLTDPAWGGLWAVLVERQRALWGDRDHRLAAAPILPYLQPGSLAARLSGWVEADPTLVAAWRLGLPGFLMALLVAFMLGRQALFATVLAIALCFVGWMTRRFHGLPNLWVQALLTIGLPWVLGHVMYAPLRPIAGVLALAFALWQRAALGIESGETRSWWLLGLAQITAMVVLVIARHPIWAAGLALTVMPVWWMRAGQEVEPSVALTRSQVWWWLALLMSGWALGSSF